MRRLADHERLKQLNDSIIQSDNREQLNVLNKRLAYLLKP